jgi:hypothetical protein
MVDNPFRKPNWLSERSPRSWTSFSIRALMRCSRTFFPACRSGISAGISSSVSLGFGKSTSLALLHRSGKVLLARASFITSRIAPGATLDATNTTSAGIPSGPGVFLLANFPTSASSSSSVNASCSACIRRRHLGMGFSGNSFFTAPSTSSFEEVQSSQTSSQLFCIPCPRGFRRFLGPTASRPPPSLCVSVA